MSDKKPPVKEYYDCHQFVDWFKKNKGVDFKPWLRAYASNYDTNNDSMINIGAFVGSFDDEEATEHKLDLKALQKAFDEVFGEGKSIELKYWW